MPATNSRRSYGSGSVYKRSDRNDDWYGKFSLGGKPRQRCLGPSRGPDKLTKAQAEAKLGEIRGDAKPRAEICEVLDIRELGNRYIKHQEKMQRKRNTRFATETALRVHFIPFFGTRSVDSITTKEVEDLISTWGKLSPKSINNYIGTLNAMYRWGIRRKFATRNPCEQIELPTIRPSDEIRFLKVEELEALYRSVLDGAYREVDHAIYVTGAMSGLREGELIGLRWKDVDWQAEKIRVMQQYTRGAFEDTPKGNRGRSVPMADRVGGELDRLFKARYQDSDDHGDDLVFVDPHRGGPLERAHLLRRYRQALKAAKLDDTHDFHALRHSYGTAMAAHPEVALRDLQHWMGHASIKTTERYAHYSRKPHETAMVNGAFSGNGSGHFPSESHPTEAHKTPAKQHHKTP